MRNVLVTGMSGTGKSTALAELSKHGFRAVETDSPDWCEWVPADDDPLGEWIWRDDRIAALLATEDPRTLFVSGCVSNQGRFYDRFGAVVLLSAPAAVILDRVANRSTNPYGATDEDRNRIRDHLDWVEPLLRATCTHEIDASQPLGEVVSALIAIGRTAEG